MKPFFYTLLLVASFVPFGEAGAASFSETTTAKGFEVQSAALHAEMLEPEYCLTFSSALKSGDRDALLSSLEVKKDGKIIKILPQMLSLSSRDLCLQRLQHRSQYTITLKRIIGENGAKMPMAFTASVSVPDRAPSLGFDAHEGAGPVARFEIRGEKAGRKQEGVPVLRSVNVPTAHISLYKVSEPALLVEAWKQVKQSSLSPSESFAFVKSKGAALFETDLVFNDKPNVEHRLAAPLPYDQGLSPGLYYLAAEPKGKIDQSTILFAGQWFLVSDLRLSAIALPHGVQIAAYHSREGRKSLQPATELTIKLVGNDDKIIAEVRTDREGLAFAELKNDDLHKVSFVIAQSAEGLVDIEDVKNNLPFALNNVRLRASMNVDKDSYEMGQTAAISLFAQDQEGKVADIGGSTLRLVRTGGKPFFESTLPKEVKGVYSTTVKLPSLSPPVSWSLDWYSKEGELLAQRPITMNKGRSDLSKTSKKESFDTELAEQGEDILSPDFDIKPVRSPITNSNLSFRIKSDTTTSGASASDNIYYLVYEKGRNFEWFPAEGHWDYKPLPQVRRVGGGHLTFDSATQEAIVSWPVGLGQYLLEIVNDKGDVLARHSFAGKASPSKDIEDNEQKFSIAPLSDDFDASKPLKLTLHAEKASVAALLMTDGTLWQAHQAFLTAGTNNLSVTLPEKWGRGFYLFALAQDQSSGQTFKADTKGYARKAASGTDFKTTMSQTMPEENTLHLDLQLPKEKKRSAFRAGGIATFFQKGTGSHVEPVLLSGAAFDEQGKASFDLNLPHIDGHVQISLYAWNDNEIISKTITRDIQRSFVIDGTFDKKLPVGQPQTFAISLTNRDWPAGSFAYRFVVPDGVKLLSAQEGTIKLDKGTNRSLEVSFVANTFIDDSLLLEIKSPKGAVQRQTWPLITRIENYTAAQEPTTTLNTGEEKTTSLVSANAQPSATIISPLPLTDTTPALYKLIWMEPKDFDDTILWLTTIDLWKDTLLGSRMISTERLDNLIAQRKNSLLAQQQENGSFSKPKGDDKDDLLSTARALYALDDPAQPAVTMASEWLAQRLQNNWFDEEEREARAFAYEAMARLGRADKASLEYFAQTCEGKDLSVAAKIALALSFWHIKDEKQSLVWHKKAMESHDPETTGRDQLIAAYWLSQSPSSRSEDISRLLPQLDVKELIKKDPRTMMLYLSSLIHMNRLAGTWKLQVNGQEQKYWGVTAVSRAKSEGKSDGLKIKNVSDKKLYLLNTD